MTTAQAAAYLGLSRRRLQELVAAGTIPSERQETARGPIHWLGQADLDAYRAQAAAINAARKAEKRRGRPLMTAKHRPESASEDSDA